MKTTSILLVLLLFVSCKSIKYLQVTDGSRSDGTLTMSYEYTDLEVPQVQWYVAIQNATARCQAWGYKGAEFFDAGTTKCIGQDSYSMDCDRWRVTFKVQCTK